MSDLLACRNMYISLLIDIQNSTISFYSANHLLKTIHDQNINKGQYRVNYNSNNKDIKFEYAKKEEIDMYFKPFEFLVKSSQIKNMLIFKNSLLSFLTNEQ